MRGIDISNWQSDVSLQLLDIDFCIVKATEGLHFVDSTCDGFVQNCKKLGLPWGFYHFARENDPLQEAEFFVKACKGYFGEGIPVLDYETTNQNNKLWCEQFITRVHDLTGIWCMLYTSASWCGMFEGSWIARKCPLWVAGYPYVMTEWATQSMPYNIYPFKSAAIWQFSDSLRLSGYGNNLDGDIAYIDKKQWEALAQGKTVKKPSVTDKATDDLVVDVLDGKFGNGDERKELLGDKYETVQNRINQLYTVAYEVLKGKWGNGWNRETALNGAGYPYEIVQRIVNEIYAERCDYNGC